MTRNEHEKRLQEMIRLYLSGWSAPRVAKKLNITPSAVYQRLKSASVAARKSGRRQRIIDRDSLIRLYIHDKLPVSKVALELKVSARTVARELKAHSIERRLTWYGHRKPSALDSLKVGESKVISFNTEHIPYGNYYFQARTRGIKISIRRVEPGRLRILRVE